MKCEVVKYHFKEHRECARMWKGHSLCITPVCGSMFGVNMNAEHESDSLLNTRA